METIKPLKGLIVVDLSQFLSGPYATLRLSDLGARVIKIERPGSGDTGRDVILSNVIMDNISSEFHSINRNKESYCANLKDENDKKKILKLISKADIVIQNFRPKAVKRLGLDYESIKKINPNIIYGDISGYGTVGPWVKKPGQDYIVQALSGITRLSGNLKDCPIPLGVAVVDMYTGARLVEGILTCLYRKKLTGKGAHVEISMLEAVIDLQKDMISSYYQDGGKATERTQTANANAYLPAPYGIYKTLDNYISIGVVSVCELGKVIGNEKLSKIEAKEDWFTRRNEIKYILSQELMKKTTKEWLNILEQEQVPCSEILNWDKLLKIKGLKKFLIQDEVRSTKYRYSTTRCPIRINDNILTSRKGSPELGENTNTINIEFNL